MYLDSNLAAAAIKEQSTLLKAVPELARMGISFELDLAGVDVPTAGTKAGRVAEWAPDAAVAAQGEDADAHTTASSPRRLGCLSTSAVTFSL
jgi:hypothetical protein